VTDPIYLAEIVVAAADRPITVSGLPRGGSVTVPRGNAIILPSHESEPQVEIFVPKRPTRPIRFYLRVDEPLARLDDLVIEELDPDEPVVVAVAATDDLDLGNFHELAEQVRAHERSLLIVIRTPDE
jgi:hypothetical protein